MAQGLETTTAIIPTFNRAGFLRETLESLFAQTLPPAEIIVADDGSTDETPAQMARLGDRIRYVRKENSGKADTLNQCLALARHPLIWIVDDDDIALPHALESLTRALSGQPEAGFAYGRYERFAVDPRTGARRIWDCGYWPEVADEAFFRANLLDFFAHHPGLLVRAEAYAAVGPFSHDYGRSEDYEMLIRLADRFDCRRAEGVVFLQRQHDGERFGGLAGDQRMARWAHEQREMFKRVRQSLPLGGYLPRGERAEPLSAQNRREALIVRGAVMARKKLWREAFEDFHAACAVEGAPGPLTGTEQRVVHQSLFSKYGSPEVLTEPDIAAGYRRLAREGPVGRALTAVFARALIWFIRRSLTTGRPVDAARYATLAISLAMRARTAPAVATTQALGAGAPP